MEDFLGLTSITLVCLITFILCLRWPRASKFLYVALIIRFCFIAWSLYNYFIIVQLTLNLLKDGPDLFQSLFDYLKNYYPGISAMFIRWFSSPILSFIPSA